jgi:hypothetical protein
MNGSLNRFRVCLESLGRAVFRCALIQRVRAVSTRTLASTILAIATITAMLSAFLIHTDGRNLYSSNAVIQWLVGAIALTYIMAIEWKENGFLILLTLVWLLILSHQIGATRLPFIIIN